MSFVMLTRRHREPSIGLEGWPLGQGAAGRMCHQCGEACFNPPQGEACGVEPLGRGTLPMGRLVLSGGWEDWGPGGW